MWVDKWNSTQENESWWWNTEVQEAIKEKKAARKASDENPDDALTRERYKDAKKRSKKAVAQSRSEASRPLYEKLGTPEGEQMIYRIAKVREKSRRDIEECNYIKNSNGRILVEDEDIKKRWKEYFEELLNVENDRGILDETPPILGPVEGIIRQEVKEALQKMKSNKAGGPTGVVIEMIKALEDEGIEWAWKLLKIC